MSVSHSRNSLPTQRVGNSFATTNRQAIVALPGHLCLSSRRIGIYTLACWPFSQAPNCMAHDQLVQRSFSNQSFLVMATAENTKACSWVRFCQHIANDTDNCLLPVTKHDV